MEKNLKKNMCVFKAFIKKMKRWKRDEEVETSNVNSVFNKPIKDKMEVVQKHEISEIFFFFNMKGLTNLNCQWK